MLLAFKKKKGISGSSASLKSKTLETKLQFIYISSPASDEGTEEAGCPTGGRLGLSSEVECPGSAEGKPAAL